MQIKQERFLDLMGSANTRFIIPVFQRVYSWDTRQCEELWEDIMNAGAQGADEAEPHFMGMLLYSADTETWHGAQQLDIIDGQQRMTTVALLLCALARRLDETGTRAGGLTADDILDRYLRIGTGTSAAGKLVLSFMDRDTLFALLGVGTMPEEPAGRLIDNLELFYAKMAEPGFDIAQLWRGVERLEIASVQLAPSDSPQLVFESLNSKGMALSTADRIRNFIVMSDEATEHVDDGVFERRWLPFERLVSESGCELDASTVVHAWLHGTFRATRIFDKAQIYGLFKSRLRSFYHNDIESALADVTAYAQRLIDDEDFRTEEVADTERWVAGKPKELISEYKMFGD